MTSSLASPEVRNLLKSVKPFLGTNGQFLVGMSETIVDLFSSSSGQKLINYLQELEDSGNNNIKRPNTELASTEAPQAQSVLTGALPLLTFLGVAYLFAEGKTAPAPETPSEPEEEVEEEKDIPYEPQEEYRFEDDD